MIEFQDVRASYGSGPEVLRGVSFSVAAGEFVALVGGNGAGKSTTLRLVNGLLRPTSGRVLLEGEPVAGMRTSEIARRVGFLFQNPDRQICCSTVRDELLFGFRALGVADERAEARARKLADDFGFNPDDDPFLLSRGERQLLALASVVAMEPRVLLLDEPTSGLDYRERCHVMDAVGRLHEQGATVIMVCHDMELVADCAERCIALADGRVVADGPALQVLRDERACEHASLEPPQMVALARGLVAVAPDLARSEVAQASTVDEMEAALLGALAAARGGAPGATCAPAKSETASLGATCAPAGKVA